MIPRAERSCALDPSTFFPLSLSFLVFKKMRALTVLHDREPRDPNFDRDKPPRGEFRAKPKPLLAALQM